MRSTYSKPGCQEKRITSRIVLDAVEKYYKVHLFSKCREPAIVRPRQVAMYLCRQYTRLSYPQIGKIWGIHHTTVCDNVARVKKMLVALEKDIREIESKLNV